MSRTNRYEYTDWKGFGSRVKRCREQIGLTKEKFAEMINRSENYVAELEKGNSSCSVHTLHQISKVIKVPTDTLLYGDISKVDEKITNKEVIEEIINRCNNQELEVIKDLIIATYPNLGKIVRTRNNGKIENINNNL